MNDLDFVLKCIRICNGGSIIYQVDDQDSEIILDTNRYKLFFCRMKDSNKYYFFAQLTLDEDDTAIDKVKLSEASEIANSVKPILLEMNSKLKALDCYFIYLLNTKEINDDIFKAIIKIEEDEYWFKKYVFYYSGEEIEEAKKLDNDSILEGFKTFNANTPEQPNLFFLRMLVKIPCLNINIKNDDFDSFDSLFNKAVEKKQNAETIKELYISMNAIQGDVFESIKSEIDAEIQSVEVDGEQ